MPLTFNLFSHLHSPFHHTYKSSVHLTEPGSLLLSNTLRSVAISIVGVFIPLYIYNLSLNYPFFSDNQILNGFSWIMAYYLLRSLFVVLMVLFFSNTIFSKLHFQLSMVISAVVLALEMFVTNLAQYNLYLIIVAGFLAGISCALYWIPYHVFFLRKSEDATNKNYGKSTSSRFFWARLVSGVSPAIGGLIIVNYGFDTLFAVGIVTLIVSALPIIFVVHEWEHREHNIKRVFKDYIFNKKYKTVMVGYFAEGVDTMVYTTFWPVLLYFTLTNFAKFGFINTISFLLSSFSVLYIGKYIEKHGPQAMHKLGSITMSVLYIPKMLFLNAPLLYALDITDRFMSGAMHIPLLSTMYDKAKKQGGSDYILFREIIFHSGSVIITGFLIFVFQFIESWRWVFVIGLIAALFTYFVQKDKN